MYTKIIARQFGVRDGEYFNMGDLQDVLPYGSKGQSGLSYATGTGQSSSHSASNDASMQFDLGTGPSPVTFSMKASASHSDSWGISTTWNENHSINAVIPGIKDPGKNRYAYRQVWYRYHIQNAEGKDMQDFMVGNWYITEDYILAGVNDATNDGTLIIPRTGAVEVRTNADTDVAIYNLQGAKVAEDHVDEYHSFDLPAGFYIVKAGDTTQKVVVNE